MNLSTASPAEVDTALAEVYGRYYTAQAKVAQMQKYLDDAEEGLAKKEATGAAARYAFYTQEKVNERADALTAAEAEASAVFAETLPYEAEFTRRGGWSRFFLVQNHGGHVHSSMACSTCFPTTRFGWLPEWSGQSESEALQALGRQGNMLCSVCYPSAPADWSKPVEKPNQCPGSLTFDYDESTARLGYYTGNAATCNQCGQRVTVTKSNKMRSHDKPQEPKPPSKDAPEVEVHGYRDYSHRPQTKLFKTVRGATNALAGELSSLVWYGETHPTAHEWLSNVEAIRKALADKGVDYDYDKALTNARKKATRQGQTPQF